MPEIVRTRRAGISEIVEAIQGVSVAFLLGIPGTEKVGIVETVVNFYIELVV